MAKQVTITHNGESLNAFSLSGNKTIMSLFTSIQHCTGCPSQDNKARKLNLKKVIPIEKNKPKLS